MLKLSAFAIALTIGLVLASAITAAEHETVRPHAQMNRPFYHLLMTPGRSHGPPQRAYKLRCAPSATAPADQGAGTSADGATRGFSCGSTKQ